MRRGGRPATGAAHAVFVAVFVGLFVVLFVVGPAAMRPAAADVAGALRTIEREDPPDAAGQDLLGAMFGVPGGDTPSSHYELGASVGVLDRIVALQARSLFTIARWTVALGLHVVEWVLRFDLGRVLAGPAGRLAEVYATRVIGGLQLIHLALLLAVARGGWLLLRHRAHAGATEIVVAMAITAMATALVAQPTTAACRGLRVLAGTTLAIVDLGTGEADREPGPCGEPQGSALPSGFAATAHGTFVADPWMTLQWGSVPTGGCRQVADALLQKGPWGDDDFPRDRMEEAGCEDHVAFNAHMGVDRLVGALAHLIACVAFAAAIAIVAVMLLLGQVAGALLVVVMPFALTAGIAPGTGRELLARWGHAVLKVGVLFLGSAVLLVLLVEAVHALQTGMQDQPVAMRMLASAGAAWAVVALRRQVFGSMRFAAQSISARAAGPGADVGAVGGDPEQRLKGAATQAVGAAMAVKTGGLSAVAAMRGSRSGEGVQTAGRGQRLLVAAAATRTSSTQVGVAAAAGSTPAAGHPVAGSGAGGPTGSSQPAARVGSPGRVGSSGHAGSSGAAGSSGVAGSSGDAGRPPVDVLGRAVADSPASRRAAPPRAASPRVVSPGAGGDPDVLVHGTGGDRAVPVHGTGVLPARIPGAGGVLLAPPRAVVVPDLHRTSEAGPAPGGVPRDTPVHAVAGMFASSTTSSRAWMVATVDAPTGPHGAEQRASSSRSADRPPPSVPDRSATSSWDGVPVRVLAERGGGWDVEGLGVERSLEQAFHTPAALGPGHDGDGSPHPMGGPPDRPRRGRPGAAGRAVQIGLRRAAAADGGDARPTGSRGRPGAGR
ncbi:hypothetical protein [Euzebya rosea]|uniref:hypothetical protein n=1 Tax=Euzebya rosea TaxID=2052804 RepID=UPI0013008BE9|nr:hypothetical protein [Euzebya rosea]